MTIKVSGMMCAKCEARVEKAVAAVEGVTSVKADRESGSVTVEGGSEAAVREAIAAAGYEVK